MILYQRLQTCLLTKKKLKLVEELNVHLSRIETIIQNEKQNISDFDDKTLTFSDMIKEMIEEMVSRLKTKEKTYIDQMAEISKDARQKLERSLKLLEQRKMYLANWLEIVSTASPNVKTETILKCLTTKEVLEAVKNFPLIQMSFDLSAKVSRGIEMMDNFGTLFSVKVTEQSVNLSDIQKEIIIEKKQALTSSSSHADESSEWALKPYEANRIRGLDTDTKENNRISQWPTNTRQKPDS